MVWAFMPSPVDMLVAWTIQNGSGIQSSLETWESTIRAQTLPAALKIHGQKLRIEGDEEESCWPLAVGTALLLALGATSTTTAVESLPQGGLNCIHLESASATGAVAQEKKWSAMDGCKLSV